MRKSIFLLIILFFSISEVYSQVVLKKSTRYGDVMKEDWANKVIEYQNRLYILGNGYNAVNGTIIEPYTEFVLCTDLCGNKIWEKKFLPNQSNKIYIRNEKLFLIKDRTFLYEVDANLNELKQFSFKNDKDSLIQFDNFIFTPDGDFILSAFSKEKNSFFDSNYGGTDHWLLRYKKNGELLWKKNFGTYLEDIGSALFQYPTDDGFVSIEDGFQFEFSQPVSKELHLIRTDYDGNIQWDTKVNTEDSFTLHEEAMDMDLEGNVYLAYTKVIKITKWTDLIVKKLDTNGKIIKTLIIPTNQGAYCGGLATEHNSVYLHMNYDVDLWQKNYTFPNGLQFLEYNHSHLVKLNKNLVPTWIYPLQDTLKISVCSGISVNQGRIALLNMREPEPDNQDIYKNDYWVTVLQDIDDYSKDCIKEINLYPNPIERGNTINIDFKEPYYLNDVNLTLSNSLGQILDYKKINILGDKIDYTLANDLSSGIYFFNISCGKQKIIKKVIIQ